MNILQSKILQAIQTNKLNPTILGERKWYNYFIRINELVWARNFVDGYLIHVYNNGSKEAHLATYTLSYDSIMQKDILQVNYQKTDD